ncbi:unnamed protein product [Dicrocoelium dendriticum]|nr:unnamed protein product [Dicrocoelium dendriticum]
MSESDSSDSELLLQAFPVPPSDTTDPPSIEKALTSPEEYIKFVRYEASSYPKVLHSGFVPSEPAEEAGQENNSFCSSSSEALPQSNEYLLSNFDSTVEEFRAVKILLSRMELDESELGELAELVSSHCTKKRWKPDLGVWVFALLVALEPPFHPDVCYSLRRIAKRCRSLKNGLSLSHQLTFLAQQREPSTLQDHSVESEFFDVCLHLVARRFGQLDLLMQ